MLKRHGIIYNFEEPLLYYRLHNKKINYSRSIYWNENRIKIINDMIK
jgi:hypothetical protein